MNKVIKLPKMDGHIDLKWNKPGSKEPVTISVRRAFMEEILADLKEFEGNGKARVSLSCDMSAKDFGNGAGVSVTISVSVDQADETINKVIDLLGVKARLLAREQLVLAGQEYNHLMKNASSVPEWNG